MNLDHIYDDDFVEIMSGRLRNEQKDIFALVDSLKGKKVSWANFVVPLKNIHKKYQDDDYTILETVYANRKDVKNIDLVYAALTKIENALASERKMNDDYVDSFKRLYESLEYDKSLNSHQRTIIETMYENWKKSGAFLSKPRKRALYKYQQKLLDAEQKFDSNLSKAEEFELIFTRDELAGVPEKVLKGMEVKDIIPSKEPTYALNVTMVSAASTIKSKCTVQSTRKRIWDHNITLNSPDAATMPKYDNTEVVAYIARLKHKIAKLLGYTDYSGLALSNRVLGSSKQIFDMYDNLLGPVKKAKKAEVTALSKLAKADGVEYGNYDQAYYKDKYVLANYSVDAEEVKNYFPVDYTIKQILSQLAEIYSFDIKEAVDLENDPFPRWNNDVTRWELSRNGYVFAELYMDLFSRKGKRTGAYFNCLRSKSAANNPVGLVVCNFSKQLGTLSYAEVQTFYHEMGHALHGILTNIDYEDIAGIAGVEWDAVELPSQINELFLDDYEVVKTITSHVETQECMPKDMHDCIISAQKFGIGLFMVRQMSFGLIDMYVYGKDQIDPAEAYAKAANVVGIDLEPHNHFVNQFAHIFAGGYSSGYYSYLFSDIMVHAVWAKIKQYPTIKEGIEAYWYAITSAGSSAPAKELVEGFLGEEIKPDAFLEYCF